MLIIILAIISSLLLLIWIRSKPLTWFNCGISWLLPWPLIGNTFTSLTSTYHHFWLDFYNKYPTDKVVGFHFFNMPALLVRDPAIVKQVTMTDAESYMSRGLAANNNDPFSKNLLLLTGEEWKLTRSKITPYFSPSRLKVMMPVVGLSVENFSQQLGIKAKEGPVDVEVLSMKLATDVVISAAFGLQPDSFTNPNSFFFKLQRELLGFLCGLRILINLLSPILYCTLGLTMLSKKTTEKLYGFVQEVLDLRTKGIGVRPDFIQGMVDLYNQDNLFHLQEKNSDEKNIAKFDRKRVASQCMIMFAAGTDSTGHTLGFLLYELAMNQEIQDKLRSEILYFKSRNNGILDYDQLFQMAYMDMVYCETLRKYPAVLAFGRKCTRDTTINNLVVRKGTFMSISTIGIHSDPKFYPDPEKFDPLRFTAGAEREIGTFLPFGLGPKACLGIKLAQLEIKLAVSEVLSKYQLTPCKETPDKLTYDFGPTLSSKNGIKLNIQEL